MVETKKENIVFGDAVKATEAKETAAKAETKAAEAKETVKETVKETAKAAPKKTTTAKKAAAPKKTVAKKETKTEVFIQYEGNQTDEEAVMNAIKSIKYNY